MLCILLYTLLVTIPCIGNMMSRQPDVLLALGWLIYGVGLTGIEIVVLVAIFRGPPGEVLLFLLAVNICQCATVFGTLRIFRALGFRFVRASPPEESPWAGGSWR